MNLSFLRVPDRDVGIVSLREISKAGIESGVNDRVGEEQGGRRARIEKNSPFQLKLFEFFSRFNDGLNRRNRNFALFRGISGRGCLN